MCIRDSDNTVRLWMDENPKDPGTFTCISTLSGFHIRSIYSCSWNADGNLLATGAGDDAITIFRLEKSTDSMVPYQLSCLENSKSAHDNDVNCVAFHPSENILASCGDDKAIKLWNVIADA
eukprot:TRINITY_DN3870_c0_g3_i1.p1 TRINITY_DN3870_c0_g3~~TRINITY_DN3870_c0_g3_i1.p1  ORF type:complete len:121 (+),score=19.73 TRINITY_DN3870_c0_g3_i1:65-427(+)